MHPMERKLAKALLELGDGLTVEEIARAKNLNVDELRRAAELLRAKKLINVDEIVETYFKLTKLGEKYLEIGLPEERLLKNYRDGISVSEIKFLDKQELAAVIGYFKRDGKLVIRDGKLYLNLSGDEMEKIEQAKKLLNFLREPKPLEEIPKELRKFIDVFVTRGIIESDVKAIRKLYATPELRKVKFEEEIEKLTPEMLAKGTWKGKKFRKYDLVSPIPELHIGKKQPYLAFLDGIKEKLVALGFKEMDGPIVETLFWNCYALFMPQDHPASDIHDIFFLKGKGDVPKNLLLKVKKTHEYGWETGSKGWRYKFDVNKAYQLVLRSQGTAISARTLAKLKEGEGRYFALARVFRPDVIDWNHLIEFNQLEGIVVGDLTFRHLYGLLQLFAEEIIGVQEYKIVPGYFPFTEPSAELHVKFKRKWMEIGGAGMFRPEVLLPLGVKKQVIAWGLGIDRMFMAKYNIKDIRQLFSQDIDWLRRFPCPR